MSKNCKAVVFTAPRKVEIQEITMPEVGPKDVGVGTLYSGISTGTELWSLTGRYWNTTFPVISGYQKTGIVEEVGAEVESFSVGDVVFLRTTRLLPGIGSQWGGHTGYSVISAEDAELFKLPEGLDPMVASMLILPAVGYHGAAEVMPLAKGEWVAVIGLGMIGQFSAQTAKLRGAKVVGLDLIEQRLELAAKYSGAITINPAKENAGELIKKHCPEGLDAVIDTSANPEAINESFKWLKNGGRYCLQAYYPDKTGLDLLWPHIHELVMYNPTNCTAEGTRQCAKNIVEGKMHIKDMITHVAGVDEAPKMFEMLLNRPTEAIGVVLDWQKG